MLDARPWERLMRVRFRSDPDGALPSELRRRLERRLRLVVGRRAPGVFAVDVTLAPASNGGGPRAAAPGHRCRIRARLRSGESFVVDEQGADLDDAIEVAAWRLEHRLGRAGP